MLSRDLRLRDHLCDMAEGRQPSADDLLAAVKEVFSRNMIDSSPITLIFPLTLGGGCWQLYGHINAFLQAMNLGPHTGLLFVCVAQTCVP